MKKLPIAGTSAASTAFCYAEITGPEGTRLFVDGNGKITAGNGTLDNPKPNAFSLPAQAVEDARGTGGTHCPGSTPTCRSSCYVGGLAKHAVDTYTMYEHNAEEIRRILADPTLADAWVMIFADWITRNASGGFRWHVSGDVFSREYAEWIADVCRESSTVRHWIYTRSFEHVPTLGLVSTERGGNLALNISCDQDNWSAAVEAANVFYVDKYGDPDGPYSFKLCYLTTDGTLPDGSDPDAVTLGGDDVIFPDYAVRGGTPEGQAWFAALPPAAKKLVCPVDMHGKSEERRCGPCGRCLK